MFIFQDKLKGRKTIKRPILVFSFLDSETNKNEISEDSADVNDNNCDISHDEVIDSENNETDYNNTNNSTVNVEICIEEARNLPYLRNNGK